MWSTEMLPQKECVGGEGRAQLGGGMVEERGEKVLLRPCLLWSRPIVRAVGVNRLSVRWNKLVGEWIREIGARGGRGDVY